MGYLWWLKNITWPTGFWTHFRRFFWVSVCFSGWGVDKPSNTGSGSGTGNEDSGGGWEAWKEEYWLLLCLPLSPLAFLPRKSTAHVYVERCRSVKQKKLRKEVECLSYFAASLQGLQSFLWQLANRDGGERNFVFRHRGPLYSGFMGFFGFFAGEFLPYESIASLLFSLVNTHTPDHCPAFHHHYSSTRLILVIFIGVWTPL